MNLRELLLEKIERTGKGDTAVIGWGRGMGHKGHMYLASSVITHAKELGGDPYFVVSRTVGKDDPITPEEKLAIYKKVFPQQGHIFQTASDELPDLTRVLGNLNQQGYRNAVVIVGADQVKAFQYVKQYNRKPDKAGNVAFTFDNLDVISRQETNDPSKGEEGPRATPMRQVLLDPSKSEEEQFAVWRDAMNPEISDDEVRDLMNKAKERMISMQPAPKKAPAKKKEPNMAEGKESLNSWEARMKKLGYKITKDNKTGTYHAWEGTTHKGSHKTQGVAEGSLNEFAPNKLNGDDGDDYTRGPGLTRQEFRNALKLALGYDTSGVDVSSFEHGMLRIEVNGERRIVPCNKLGVKDAANFVKRIKQQGVAEGSDKLQGTPVVSLSDFDDKDYKKNKYGQTVPKKLKKDDPRVKFHKDDKKQGVAEGGSKALAQTARRLTDPKDGATAKLRAAGDKRREDQMKGRHIARRDNSSKDEWGNFKEQLAELSNELLGNYKKAASADASKADKEGNFKKGDNRFSGIVKATNKQFSNDIKKHKK